MLFTKKIGQSVLFLLKKQERDAVLGVCVGTKNVPVFGARYMCARYSVLGTCTVHVRYMYGTVLRLNN